MPTSRKFGPAIVAALITAGGAALLYFTEVTLVIPYLTITYVVAVAMGWTFAYVVCNNYLWLPHKKLTSIRADGTSLRSVLLSLRYHLYDRARVLASGPTNKGDQNEEHLCREKIQRIEWLIVNSSVARRTGFKADLLLLVFGFFSVIPSLLTIGFHDQNDSSMLLLVLAAVLAAAVVPTYFALKPSGRELQRSVWGEKVSELWDLMDPELIENRVAEWIQEDPSGIDFGPRVTLPEPRPSPSESRT